MHVHSPIFGIPNDATFVFAVTDVVHSWPVLRRAADDALIDPSNSGDRHRHCARPRAVTSG